MTERQATGSNVLPVLAALAAGIVLFIPMERLIDSWFPGNHAGFGMMGVWFWIVVPASIVLGVALVLGHRRAAVRDEKQARRVVYFGWLFTGLLYLVATWLYRRTG